MTDLRLPLQLDTAAQDLLFRSARTANSFTDEPVTDDEVRAIYDLVKWAPTAMNAQPLRILLIRQGEARDRLLAHLAPGNRDKTASAPLIAVLAADTDFHERLPEVFPHAPGARDRFAADAEGRAETARFNASLQAGYLLVGVRAGGLAAGPMAGFDTEGVDRDLLAGTGWRSFLVLNIGHPSPDAWFDRLPRLPYDDVVRSADDLQPVRQAA